MQMQRLPIELVDAIISFLADAKNDLAACSLVCKEWVMPARRYLFHTILFTTTPDLYLDRLRGFHALLDNNPYLCGYIKFFEFTHSLLRWQQFRLDIGVAFDLLSRFTALDALLVASMCFGPATPETALPTCQARSLELRFVVPRDTTDTEGVARLFHRLPGLRNLTLNTCCIGHDRPGRAPTNHGVVHLPLDLRLESLRIESSVIPSVLSALINTATVESIRSLAVLIPFFRRSEYNLDYVKAFLEKVGSQLRSFEFRYDASDYEYGSESEAELESNCRGLITRCTYLEELTLHTHFGLPCMPTISWTYTSRILSDITAPKLKHLTFIVSSRVGGLMGSEDDVTMWREYVPWEAIRESLSRLQLLETLTFVSEREQQPGMKWRRGELRMEVQIDIRKKLMGCLQDMTEVSFDVLEK